AALLMTFLADEQTYRDDQRLERVLLEDVNESEFEPLLSGVLVLAYQQPPADDFAVGYEFELDGDRYCYVMRGQTAASINRGPLNPRVRSSYSGRRGRSLLLDEPDSNPQLHRTSGQDFRI